MTTTNEMLSNSQIRYNYLISSIPEVIGELDLDGTISFVSPQVYGLLGYHPDEMIGTNYIKFIHPNDVPSIKKAIKKANKSKEVLLSRLRIKHKKDNYILVFAKGKLIKLNDKVRLIGFIRDINKFNENEKKIEESRDILEQFNEVFLKFKEDPIFNLQLLINAAGILLNADCALFNILKRVNGKEVLESLVTYNEPPNFTRESDAKGHICTEIIKNNPDDVVILSNLDKTNYAKTDENVRKYDLKQYISYVVRINNKPTAIFCVFYKENREMSNNDIKILQILSKSASTELARWNSGIDSQKLGEKYLRLINNLTDIILELDIKGKVTYVSPQCYNIMGYQPAEIIGKNVMGFIHSDDLMFIAEAMKQAIKTNEILTLRSYRLIHKNGDSIYVSAKGKYVNIGGKEKYIGVIRDERERKKVETELKESEGKYKSLFELSPMAILLINFEGKIEDCNNATKVLFGYTKEELLGNNYLKFDNFPLDTKLILAKSFSKFLKTGVPERSEIQMYRKDGKMIWISSYPISVKIGEISYILAVIQNVTDRVLAEQELQENERLLKNAQELAHIGHWKLDPSTLEVSGSDELFKIFDLTQDEATLEQFAEVFHPEDREMVLFHIRRGLEKGESWNIEHRVISKDGMEKWVHDLGEAIKNDDGKVIILMGTVQDITERKIAEQNLKESEELFRTIFETAKDCIFIKDRSLQYIRINKAMEELFGVSSEDLLNKTDIEIFGLEAGKHVMEIDQRVIQGEIIEEEPTEPINGIPHTFHTIKVPLKDTQGNIYGLCGFARDISDRKIFEQKLRESEEKFRTISEQSLMGIVILQDDKYKYVNQVAADMFGYTVEELLTTPQWGYLNYIHPEDREFIREQATKKQLGMEDVIKKYPYRGLTKSGETIWVQNYSRTITYEGKYADLVTMIDFTERKKAQKALKESEERFKYLISSNPAVIYTSKITSDYGATFISDNAMRLWGFEPKSLTENSEFWIDHVHPDDKEFVLSSLSELSDKDHIIYDYRFKIRNDTYRWMRDEVFLIRDDRGNPKETIGSVIDITDRKISELKLKESEKKYRALFENAPIGVAISDYEGHAIEINEYMKKLLGYELEEFQKLGVAAAYANDQDRIPFKNRLEEQGYIQDYEIDLKKKDGKVFPALLNSIKTNVSGGPIYINTIRDITAKKEIEEIKTHLLTRFSHEFKTPLISINGFSDLLLSEYKNKLDEKMIGFLERIKDGGERLKLLVNAFMQSSQLGEKLTRLNLNKENLSDLIKLGVSEVEGLIHLRKHTINLDIPEKLIGEFDKEKIYSVITNLLMNAIKYTPLEGKIFIHSKIEEDDIFFSIKDSGIGLTEEDKRHLFKPFGKIERYGKGWDIVSEGMGVGLYLSKEIISLHGGKIWAESEGKNKGSTFYFSLPMTNN